MNLSVRQDAGHSFKSSVNHSYVLDGRDDPLLPSRGFYFRTSEVGFIICGNFVGY